MNSPPTSTLSLLNSEDSVLNLILDYLYTHSNNNNNNINSNNNEHQHHHDSDESKFEKIFDRLKSIFLNDDNKAFKLNNKFNILNRTCISIKHLYDIEIQQQQQQHSHSSSSSSQQQHYQSFYQDSTTTLQRLLAANIRLFGFLVNFKSISNESFNHKDYNSTLEFSTIKLISNQLLQFNNPSIKYNCLLAIQSFIDGNKFQIDKILALLIYQQQTTDTIINNNNNNSTNNSNIIEIIFKSFIYPSNFVSRLAVEVFSSIFKLNSTFLNNVIINLIDKAIVNENELICSDLKLCLLDFFIIIVNYLKTPVAEKEKEKEIDQLKETVKDSNLFFKLCSLLFDENRLVKNRTIELISIVVEYGSKSLEFIGDFNGVYQFFNNIIENLLIIINHYQQQNKESIITLIDLIGSLESSFIFSNNNSNSNNSTLVLFNKLNPIIESIINNCNNSNNSNLSIYQFHLFQCIKEILKRNNLVQFDDQLIRYIVESSLIKSNYIKLSNKTLKESLECLERFNINDWINIQIEPLQTQIFNNSNSSSSDILYIFLKGLIKLSKPILKISFNVLFKIILNFNSISSSFSYFKSEFLDQINSLLMSPYNDIRDLTLGFLKRIYSICSDGTSDHLELKKFLFSESNLLEQIIKRLTDSDNYVRSTTLELIGIVSIDLLGWESLCKLNEPLFKEISQIQSILIEKPVLTINDQVCNNNQINLNNYTELLEKEIKDRDNNDHTTQEPKNHLFYNDTISIASSKDLESVAVINNNNDTTKNQDWEWEDEEFKELMKRNQENIKQENFMNEYELEYSNYISEHDISLPSETLKLFNYKFPYSIILFLNDEDSYPRISSIENLILWINYEHSFKFLYRIINDEQENQKYTNINNLVSKLLDDNGYWEVKFKLLEFLTILFKKESSVGGQLTLILKLNCIELLIKNIKNNLEDKLIRNKSLSLLKEIYNYLYNNNNDNQQQSQPDYNNIIQFINKSIDIKTEEINCSTINDFTLEEEEDIELYNQTYNNNIDNNNHNYSNNNNKENILDCY